MYIQPILSASDSASTDIVQEFVSQLLLVARSRLESDIPMLLQNGTTLAHVVNQTQKFDALLSTKYAYSTVSDESLSGLCSVFTEHQEVYNLL